MEFSRTQSALQTVTHEKEREIRAIPIDVQEERRLLALPLNNSKWQDLGASCYLGICRRGGKDATFRGSSETKHSFSDSVQSSVGSDAAEVTVPLAPLSTTPLFTRPFPRENAGGAGSPLGISDEQPPDELLPKQPPLDYQSSCAARGRLALAQASPRHRPVSTAAAQTSTADRTASH